VYKGDFKNDKMEGKYTYTDGGRVRGRLEERRAQGEGSQASRARGRRAQEEGGQVGFEVSFPSGRARATFEILRILKQTRILGSQAEILLIKFVKTYFWGGASLQ
jgi:hypothetical protein|tara:strand:- start:61 stop:375 length:315 start_codon:yes stop_codon:yes gene_type:complete